MCFQHSATTPPPHSLSLPSHAVAVSTVAAVPSLSSFVHPLLLLSGYYNNNLGPFYKGAPSTQTTLCEERYVKSKDPGEYLHIYN